MLPAYALYQLAATVDWRLPGGACVVVSLFAFAANWTDKRRAEAGEWRIPESTLHTAELAGGWPGAFLAQRMFRHKTAKESYQVVFWLIVLLYQLVALDSLLGWRFTKALLRLNEKPHRVISTSVFKPSQSLKAECFFD